MKLTSGIVALAYVAIAAAWIAVSDGFFGTATPVNAGGSWAHSGKDMLFVAGTGLALYLLLRRLTRGNEQAQAALRDSEARLRAIVHTAVEGIVTMDERGVIESFNPSAEQMFGYSATEIIGQRVNRLMPETPSAEHDQFLENYLRTGVRKIIGIGRQVDARHKDGTIFPIELAVSEIHLDRKRVFAGILRDMTERQRMTRQLLEQESLVRLGTMAAVLAHEIRNPLAAISGAIQVIGERLEGDASMTNVIGRIQERIRDLSSSIDDLLLFSRPKTPERRDVRVHEILSGTVELLRNHPEFDEVEIDTRGDDVQLSLDAKLIIPAITNLLINAAQAIKRKGRIVVEVECMRRACRIVITDDGPGIPADVLERIFDPFFTTKSRGTGLGLPTTRQIVRAHGGEIRVTCPAGGGTRVQVELPLKSMDPNQQVKSSASG